MSNSTQSVLDAMTAGIMARKQTAKAPGATLTPVGTEPNGPLDVSQPLAFPFDRPDTAQQAIRQGLGLVTELVAELDHVRAHLTALAGVYGVDVDASNELTAEEIRRATERAADQTHVPQTVVVEHDPAAEQRDFDAAMAAQSAAAKAAVFTDAPLDGPGPWSCPEHGPEATDWRTSRAGRRYRACTACGAFERLA